MPSAGLAWTRVLLAAEMVRALRMNRLRRVVLRAAVLLVAVLAASTGLPGFDGSSLGGTSPGCSSALAAADEARPLSVELVVDFGDGAEVHLKGLPYRSGMTALDAVEAANAHPHGVKFKLRGSGATAFVIQVGDLKNEGAGAKSRNWIYTVDGEQPDVGIGSFELKPGGVVLWKFGPADYNR